MREENASLFTVGGFRWHWTQSRYWLPRYIDSRDEKGGGKRGLGGCWEIEEVQERVCKERRQSGTPVLLQRSSPTQAQSFSLLVPIDVMTYVHTEATRSPLLFHLRLPLLLLIRVRAAAIPRAMTDFFVSSIPPRSRFFSLLIQTQISRAIVSQECSSVSLPHCAELIRTEFFA